MFMFDVETLGTDSSSVCLSLAAIYFNPDKQPTPEEMRKDAFFVKFNVEDQVRRFKRKIDLDTLDWWKKQCENARKASFVPNEEQDKTLEDGYKLFSDWVKSKNDNKCWVWARGSMDEVILCSIERNIGASEIWPYNRWRDVRTAIDFLQGTSNGYCGIDYAGFDRNLHITKHIPVDDCLLDIMMLVYGTRQEVSK